MGLVFNVYKWTKCPNPPQNTEHKLYIHICISYLMICSFYLMVYAFMKIFSIAFKSLHLHQFHARIRRASSCICRLHLIDQTFRRDFLLVCKSRLCILMLIWSV